MAQPARAAASAKAAPKKERSGTAVVQPKRAAPAVPRVAPRAAPCACGGHCPKCQRQARVPDAPSSALREDAAAEQEAEQIARVLSQAFAGAAPIPPPDANDSTNTTAASEQPAPARLRPPPTRPRIQSTSRPDSSLGSGSPLPEPIRRRLEPALGFDLSSLRVHTDASAQRLAERYDARAFAYGSHLIFGRGEYAPDHAQGWNVLTHEIVHVVQQSAVAHDPWSSGSLSTQARPRGPPSRGTPLVSVQHCFARPRVQRLPSWSDVSNTFVAVGSAAVDTAVDVGSSAVGVAVDLGEGALEVGAEVIERTADFFIGLIDDYAPGLLEFLRGGFMSRLTDLFCRGLDAVIGGLISSLEDIDFVSALEEAFSSAQGSVEGVIGAIRSGASSALGSLMQPVVEALDEYGPGIIDAITGASDSVNGFFDSLWESIGAPAMDFLGEAGGAIWEEISGMIDWLWEATADVREAAADAWDWVMEQFGIAWESTSGIRDWLAEKATAAWDAMKEALGPLEGPITVLLGILLVLSPLGPIIIATQVIPPLWEKLVWLWNNWNTDDILVWAQDTLREDILPGIIGMVSGVASAIASAASWIAGVTVQVADAFGGVIGVFGGNSCLATVTRVLNAVSSQFERLAAWAEGGFTGLADAVSNVFHSIVAILQPILDFLVRLVMVVANPPLLPIAIAGAVWLLIPNELKPPVINFILDLIIAFLSGFPAFLTGLGPLASILKAGFLGFLEGLRGAEDEQKVNASNKVANLMAGAGLEFIAGFAVGILQGLIDGILDPFRLIWMLIQFLARLCRSIGDYLAPLLFSAAPELGTAVTDLNASVRATIPAHPPAHAPPAAEGAAASAPAPTGEIATLTRTTPGSMAGPTAVAPPTGGATASAPTSPSAAAPAASPEDAVMGELMAAGPTASDAAIVASLSPGLSGQLTGAAGELDAAGIEGESSAHSEVQSEGSSVGGLADLLGGVWTAILEGAHGLGGRAAGALLEFIMMSDYELGNKVGYVAGLVLLEVIIAYFSGGVSVQLKAAQPFIKAAIRFLDLGGEILGLLGRAVRPIKGPLLRGLSAAGEHLGRFRFLQPIIQRIRRAADTLFHFGDEAAEAAGRAGGRADDVARHADDVGDAASAGRRVDDAAGAGRHADDAAGAGRHADDAGRQADDAALEAAEKPAALALARSICDTNDALRPSPPASVVLAQLMALRAQFTWIDSFRADPKGPGRYEFHLIASDTVVKNNYTAGSATESASPPVSHADLSLEELRSLSRTDPDAAYELWRRYQNMPREDLRRLARQGDESAQAVLRQTEVPGSEPWLDPHEFLSRDPGMVGQSHHLDQNAAFRDVIPRDEGLAIKLEGNAFTQPGTPHYEAHRVMENFWDQFRSGGARAGQLPNQFEYSRAVRDSMLAAGYTREQALAIARASLEHRLRHGLAGASVPRIPGRLRQVQPKLIVTRPGDIYEQEADRAANAVMSAGGFSPPVITAYRENAAMRAAGAEGTRAEVEPSFERGLDVSESGGRTLPKSTRTHMESRFGVDFSDVRVHHDDQAAALNRKVASRAFTTGQHIYFAPGQYQPGTAGGDRLLAHELTHVAQQAGGRRSRHAVQHADSRYHHRRDTGAHPRDNRAHTGIVQREVDEDAEAVRRREALGSTDWLSSIPPIVMDDNAPVLIAWAQKQAEKFEDPDASDQKRMYIAQGLLKVHKQLRDFEGRAHRGADGELVYKNALTETETPWTDKGEKQLDEIAPFTPLDLVRWKTAAKPLPAGIRRSRKPPPAADARKRRAEPARPPPANALNITFPKQKDMSVKTEEGQRVIMAFVIASTRRGLSADQIGWLASQLSVEKRWQPPAGVDLATWQTEFEDIPVGGEITLTITNSFTIEVDHLMMEMPSIRDFQLEGVRQGVVDAEAGLYLGIGTFAVGTLALGGGAAIGGLMSAAGGAGVTVPTLLGQSARYAVTHAYLNAPTYYGNLQFAIGAGSAAVTAYHVGDKIIHEGFELSDLGTIASAGVSLYGGISDRRYYGSYRTRSSPSVPMTPDDGPAPAAPATAARPAISLEPGKTAPASRPSVPVAANSNVSVPAVAQTPAVANPVAWRVGSQPVVANANAPNAPASIPSTRPTAPGVTDLATWKAQRAPPGGTGSSTGRSSGSSSGGSGGGPVSVGNTALKVSPDPVAPAPAKPAPRATPTPVASASPQVTPSPQTTPQVAPAPAPAIQPVRPQPQSIPRPVPAPTPNPSAPAPDPARTSVNLTPPVASGTAPGSASAPSTTPAPASAPAPNPAPGQRTTSNNACRGPTGLTPADPIPIRWFKPLYDTNLYPSPITLMGQSYYIDRVTRLPRGEPIGVARIFRPRLGKIVQLFPEPRSQGFDPETGRFDSQTQRYRETLRSYGFFWGHRRYLQADHVMDLQWAPADYHENRDQFRNMWPLDAPANTSAGNTQNNLQVVSFCETPTGPHRTISLREMKDEARANPRRGFFGRYFVITSIGL